jgi:hypothetical protein
MEAVEEVEHTPDPWKIAEESYNDAEAYVIEAVGFLCGIPYCSAGDRTICWTASSLDDAGIEVIAAEDEANAHLIAAAPDLLESLKDLENILSCKPYDRDEQKLLIAARAAIAKAKGVK